MFIQSGDRSNYMSAAQGVDACLAGFGSALGVLAEAGQEYRMNVAYDNAMEYIAELEGNQKELVGYCHDLADKYDRAMASARALRLERFKANQRIAELEAQLASRQ